MTSPSMPSSLRPLDFSRWSKVPGILIASGAALSLIGAVVDLKEFGYSWLLAFMFYLSLVLGAAFLVMMHHLFDASWSVGIRRFCEHLACLSFPWMAIFFLPIALLAPKIYHWMSIDPAHDHALAAKWPLFTRPAFYLASVICLGAWGWFSYRLRHWSLKQDEDGSAQCTYRMRLHSAWGIFSFGFTLSLGAIMWMKALQHEWFSSMYGVYYFAGCVWFALAVAYVIALILDRQGMIRDAMGPEKYYFLGSLLLAFTVFSAYIHFSQYFVIWNANIPEETFWYVLRERGSWWTIGLILIFGHFLVPFLALLRIDVKLVFKLMIPVCVWIALMQYVDLSFNIKPVLHPDGFPLRWVWLDAGCLALMGGVLAKAFLRDLNRYPAYPVKDPRLAEAMGLYPEMLKLSLEEKPRPGHELPGAPPHSSGGGQ